MSLYAAAFALMLVAAIALMASSLGSLRSIGLLWISSALSLFSAALAVASVLVPKGTPSRGTPALAEAETVRDAVRLAVGDASE